MFDKLYGREKIYSKFHEITAKNVVDALNAALPTHKWNASRIDFLHRYYRGETPILCKSKDYRKSVNNKVGVATAKEAVDFFEGFIMNGPISYIRRSEDDSVTASLMEFNNWCRLAGKEPRDIELVSWAMQVGVAYRLCTPELDTPEYSPFAITTIPPQLAFVAYDRQKLDRPVFACVYTKNEEDEDEYIVYTRNWIFRVKGDEIMETEYNEIGEIPVIEYAANPSRTGCFENAVPLLDAMEALQSSRLDAVIQSVDSVLAIIGSMPDSDTEDAGSNLSEMLQRMKMLLLPEGADAKYIVAPLQQADAQTLYDSLYSSALAIMGVPSRSGSNVSSTSDTGEAAIYRGGWKPAEAKARAFEATFKEAENRFIQIVTKLAQIKGYKTVDVRDIEAKFASRSTGNILAATQAMVEQVKIGIRLADAAANTGITSDPVGFSERNQIFADRMLFEPEGRSVGTNTGTM